MEILDDYIGMEPFTVKIDDSAQLRHLIEKARKLRQLEFAEKLEQVKKLTLDAMVNAYESMKTHPSPKERQRYFNIVASPHPLSEALRQQAGCCRYQGALFFVLGLEAELGDKHFIQGAPVNQRVNTVFNELINDGQVHNVSIFTESLKDKSLDYSVENPRLFEQVFKQLPGYTFYSYHRTPTGIVLVANPNQHVTGLPV